MFLGAADAATHKIYVWDLNNEGVLYEAVEGGRERLVDVQVNKSLINLFHLFLIMRYSGILRNH